MPRPIAEKQLAQICGVIDGAADGCALGDIAAALSPWPPRRNLQRWLSALVREKRIARVGARRTARYRSQQSAGAVGDIDPDVQPLPVRRGSAAQAIQILVSRPLAERAPTTYRRAWLDAYEPNKTWYLPEDVRKQLLTAPGMQGGAALLGDPAWRKKFTEDVALFGVLLEGESANRAGLQVLLGTPETREDERRVVKLAWNHHRCVEDLASRRDKVSVTSEEVLGIADWMDSQIIRSENGEPVGDSALRIGPLTLSGSAYQPPAGDATLRATFEQLVATAAAINDPFEQAFFLFVHLLYLQPFNFNFATACLAANLPLVKAKLMPIAFATVPARDIRAAALGVCELNRLELIRQVFLQAYFDRLPLPDGHPWKR